MMYGDAYWETILLPRLGTLFDNCLAPDIISPQLALQYVTYPKRIHVQQIRLRRDWNTIIREYV